MRRRTITRLELDVRELAALTVGIVLGHLAALLIAFPGQLSRESSPAPVLRDLSGRYVIGCGFDVSVSAPEVCVGVRVVGLYLDDSTPRLPYWVALAVAKYSFVIVAEGPGQWTAPAYCSLPQVLCAREWYVYGDGYPSSDWGPMPKARAYILQYRFRGFANRGAPTRRQFQRLLAQARRFHPSLILLY